MDGMFMVPGLAIIAEQAPQKSRQEMDALATIPGVETRVLPGTLGMHEEYAIEVADVALPFLAYSWLGQLLQTQGTDIFRMKGILNIAGEDQRFVFQGVHMLFDGTADRPWKPTETRNNQLVFIGRNLDEAKLKEDFRSCLV